MTFIHFNKAGMLCQTSSKCKGHLFKTRSCGSGVYLGPGVFEKIILVSSFVNKALANLIRVWTKCPIKNVLLFSGSVYSENVILIFIGIF